MESGKDENFSLPGLYCMYKLYILEESKEDESKMPPTDQPRSGLENLNIRVSQSH